MRCEVCGEEHDSCDSKHVTVKGKLTTVCQGCAAEMKGFS